MWLEVGLTYLQEMEEHELWGEADQPAPDVGEGGGSHQALSCNSLCLLCAHHVHLNRQLL